ncbi:MAG: DUF58 domain-containing protein [Roseiflexaceae bacterium]|nr:DUF58 domain-containing protein [Roseiflexaceae bacterium]
MNTAALQSFLQRWRDRLTLHGRVHLRQPWALVPGPIVLILALLFPYRWLFFLAYAWFMIIGACYLWVWMLTRSIRLQRTLKSAWAEVGDQLEEQWELENPARLPIVWLEIYDVSTVPGYSARRVAAAGPGETQRWITIANCTRRGVYALGPLTARLADPLGIFGAEWRQGEPRQIVVYPTLVRVPNLIPPRGQSGGLARADLLQQMATPSVGGLREYVPGDLPSRIHWPTVARTDQLMVKEFDQERAGALWIALDLYTGSFPVLPLQTEQDGSQLANAPQEQQSYGQSSVVTDDPHQQGPDTLLELAVVMACSLAAQALSVGQSVGLIANDGQQRVVTPSQGPRQLWRILGALVDAQATGTIPPGRLMARGPGSPIARSAGAALLLVTTDLGGAWVGDLAGWQSSRSGGAQVVLIAAAGVRADELIGRMSSIGASAQLYRLGDRFPLLHPARPRPISRVSPLGRIRRESS